MSIDAVEAVASVEGGGGAGICIVIAVLLGVLICMVMEELLLGAAMLFMPMAIRFLTSS
jgi:hypothetical protein